MAKNKVTIDKGLINDLNKYASSVCKSMATQVRDELYEEAKYAIESFYSHYSPIYYNRHYDNFRNNSFTKYYKNPHGSIIRGGVELTPENISDIYRVDSEYVFNLVYLGYHGNVNMFPHEIHNVPPVMNPSPLDMLIKKREQLINNVGLLKATAIDYASSQSYVFINT